ncbi:MAG: histidine--tRNA ligase [Candidatus Omnitrophica bacterium]|nr:histidine--tRNA ligase [Candidatus Omnitrophota bacterium]
MFKRVPGTKDILPEEAPLWLKLEETSRAIFSLYNFKEIRPPMLEEESLFNRSLGESAEIVQKQMFVIKNKEDVYALRPEGTASIVRAYLENNLDKTAGFSKLYYIGPMFRLERPQKGRLRQFHHIGCEAIGSQDADLDVEVISLADYLLKAYEISGYNIKINTLGCPKDKSELNSVLHKALKDKLPKLCDDCKDRFKKNTLRILDCKNESCKEIIKDLRIGDSHICPECKEHFAKVRGGLDALGVSYEVVPLLVRGLDYYNGTVFEITHPDLGSQDAIGAGGRYNHLVKELGGPEFGAIGFAFGVERLLLVAKPQSSSSGQKPVYLITLGEEAKKAGLKILSQLRQAGIPCDTDYEGKSLKGAMRKANDLGAKYVLILGDNEIKSGTVTLKNMENSEQKEVMLADITKELKC